MYRLVGQTLSGIALVPVIWIMASGYAFGPGLEFEVRELSLLVVLFLAVKAPTAGRLCWSIVSITTWFVAFLGASSFGLGMDILVAGWLLLIIPTNLLDLRQGFSAEGIARARSAFYIVFLFSLFDFGIFADNLEVLFEARYSLVIAGFFFGLSYRNFDELQSDKFIQRIVMMLVISFLFYLYRSPSINGLSTRGYDGFVDSIDFFFTFRGSAATRYAVLLFVPIASGILVRQFFDGTDRQNQNTDILIYAATILAEFGVYRFYMSVSGDFGMFELYVGGAKEALLPLALYAGLRFRHHGVYFVAFTSVIIFIHSNIDLGRFGFDGGAVDTVRFEDGRDTRFDFYDLRLDNGLRPRVGVSILPPQFITELCVTIIVSAFGMRMRRILDGDWGVRER